MAENKTYGLTFSLNAKTQGGFQKNFNAASGALNELGQKLQKYQDQAKKIDKIIKLRKETQDLSKTFFKQKETLENLNKAMEKTKSPSKIMVKAQKEAQRNFDSAKRSMDRQRDSLRKLNQEMNTTGRSSTFLAKRQAELMKATEAVKARNARLVVDQRNQALYAGRKAMIKAGIGYGIMKAAPVVGYGLRKMVSSGAENEAAMAQTYAENPNLTDDEKKKLNAQANRLGSSTQFNYAQVAAGQRAFISENISAKDAMVATPDLLKFATANGSDDLGDAANKLLVFTKGYQLAAEKMGEVSDSLMNAKIKTGTDLSILVDAARKSGKLLSQSGTSINEHLAMASILAAKGVGGSEIDSGLSAMQLKFMAPSSEGRKIFKAIGLKVTDPNGKQKKPVELLEELNQKMKERNLSDEKRATLLKMVFGDGAAPLIDLLLKESQNIGKTAASFGETGLTDRVAKIRTDTLDADMVQLGGSLNALNKTIFDNVSPLLRIIVKRGTSAVQYVNETAEAHPKATAALTAGGSVLASSTVIALIYKLGKRFLFGAGGSVNSSLLGKVLLKLTPWGRVITIVTTILSALMAAAEASPTVNKSDKRRNVDASGLLNNVEIDSDFPTAAKGGITTRPTLALVGEGGESEAIIPLSRFNEVASSVGSTGGVNVNFAPVINISGTSGDVYADVKRGVSEGRDSLKRELQRLLADQARLGYA